MIKQRELTSHCPFSLLANLQDILREANAIVKVSEVITSAAFVISATFTSVYYADRPRSGAKKFIPENYAR